MGKGKPRHNPNKKQNNYPSDCWMYETGEDSNGEEVKWCIRYGTRGVKICGGNPHNCSKVLYRIAASRSDIQKANDVEPIGLRD